MQLTQDLYNHFAKKARAVRISQVCLGLSYTAVTTDDGGIGLAYTYLDPGGCCSKNKDYRDYEGEMAIEMLQAITDPAPLRRSMGLALVNALNYREASRLPEASDDRSWMEAFGIGAESRIAMVGLFRPLVKILRDRRADVEVIDDFQGIGEQERFFKKLTTWADVVVLTSTSILNGTTEDILEHVRQDCKVIMIGPSTPLIADVFRGLPVHILAGTVPSSNTEILKAVRHGTGTPVIHRHSRKVCLSLP